MALFSALATSFTLTLTTTTGGRTHLGGWSSRRGGAVTMAGWTGSTSASVDVPAVPADVLYNGYADLSRMTEWSPLLDSVTVDPDEPSHSVWVMRVPSALQAAADMLGYPAVTLSWEADLVAPGPPYMNWTSTLDEDGKLKGLPNAGFEPSGAVVVEEVSPDLSRITLTLKYAMPDGVPSWQYVRRPPSHDLYGPSHRLPNPCARPALLLTQMLRLPPQDCTRSQPSSAVRSAFED